jgi:hypothetical protein
VSKERNETKLNYILVGRLCNLESPWVAILQNLTRRTFLPIDNMFSIGDHTQPLALYQLSMFHTRFSWILSYRWSISLSLPCLAYTCRTRSISNLCSNFGKFHFVHFIKLQSLSLHSHLASMSTPLVISSVPSGIYRICGAAKFPRLYLDLPIDASVRAARLNQSSDAQKACHNIHLQFRYTTTLLPFA